MTTFTAFQLVADHDDFIVVDKIADVNFHDEGTLGAGLFSQVKQQLALAELYPVHRLDKITSGLVIFAKNLSCAQQFQQLFAQHQIEKYYLALSDKKPKKKQGMIKGDMSKSRRGTWKLLRSQQKPALTQFFSYSVDAGLRLFIVKPLSGKTHQIRVALNSISAPILGDIHYGASQADRAYLHAYALNFTLNQQHFSYVCPPNSGQYFLMQNVQQCLNNIPQVWQLNWPKVKA